MHVKYTFAVCSIYVSDSNYVGAIIILWLPNVFLFRTSALVYPAMHEVLQRTETTHKAGLGMNFSYI